MITFLFSAPCEQQPEVTPALTLDPGGGSPDQIWSEPAGTVHIRDTSCVKKKVRDVLLTCLFWKVTLGFF